MTKKKLTNGWSNYRGSHDTIKMKAIMKESKLVFLSLTYATTLIVKSIVNYRTSICSTRITTKALGVSNNPKVQNYVIKTQL